MGQCTTWAHRKSSNVQVLKRGQLPRPRTYFKDLTVKAKDKDLTVKAKDKDLTVKAKDKDLTVKVKDKDLTVKVKAKDKDLTVKAKNKDLTVKAKDKDLTVKAKDKDLTVKAKAKDLTIKVKDKDMPHCPRGTSRWRTWPRSLQHCFLHCVVVGKVYRFSVYYCMLSANKLVIYLNWVTSWQSSLFSINIGLSFYVHITCVWYVLCLNKNEHSYN